MVLHRAKRYAYNKTKDCLARFGFLKYESDLEFIFTSSNGLYLYRGGRIVRLLSGNYFGVTQFPDGSFLAVTYVQNGTRDERSHAETFRIENDHVVDRNSFDFYLPSGEQRVPVRVHQILYHNELIWIANTRQNLIWKCNRKGQILQEWTYSEAFDYESASPGTDAIRNKARTSPHYHHFNSIAIHDGFMYLLAHNSAGNDKSRMSFYLKLDMDLNVLDKVEDVGKACHNLVPYEGDFFICDSGNGRIVHGNCPAIELGYFVRGLGIANMCLIAGGTVSADDPSLRGRGDSRIFVVPIGATKPICSFSLGRTGDIHELLILSS